LTLGTRQWNGRESNWRPLDHKSDALTTTQSIRRGTWGCAANCKQAELLHLTKNKRIPNLLPSLWSMSQTPNNWNIYDVRGEEGKGWRGMEEHYREGPPCPWVQGRRPTAVNQVFFTFWRNTNYTFGIGTSCCKFSVSIVKASLSKIMKIG